MNTVGIVLIVLLAIYLIGALVDVFVVKFGLSAIEKMTECKVERPHILKSFLWPMVLVKALKVMRALGKGKL